MIRFVLSVLILCNCVIAESAVATSNDPYIPESLLPWKAWVLEEHDDIDCPTRHGQVRQSVCEWPSRLELDVNQHQLTFLQEWTLYRESWVQLPGDFKYWPLGVTTNTNPIEVIARDNLPSVFLPSGRHLIRGTINFDKRPQNIQIPDGSALVSLRLDDVLIDRINIEPGGRMWFGESGVLGPSQERQDKVQAQVFRRIADGVPVTLETLLRLTVAGQDRELTIGRLLEEGGKPVRFESPLPARLEEDGSMRIQVRAGVWDISLLTRHEESEPTFQMERMDANWPTREIWLFEANRDVRTVELSGAAIVDSSLSDIPPQWLHLPAYLLEENTRLTIRETSQGESVSPLDDLDISRGFWLDFDGEGMTVQDAIRGTVNRAWRIGVLPGVELGRAELNGTPQLITRMGEDGDQGLELREGAMSLDTISRIDFGGVGGLSVTGWQHDFSSVRGSLNLPPGWLLLHAGGVDRAPASWVEKWDLWDTFLLLLVAFSIGRLMGIPWGLLALGAVALTYHDALAPLFIWLVIAATIALVKLTPEGTFRKWLYYFQHLSLLALALMSVVYGVDEIRKAIYPQIERSVVVERAQFDGGQQAKVRGPVLGLTDSYPAIEEIVVTASRVEENFLTTARIQTGPSVPDWQWSKHDLLWDGPVNQNQNMHFYLASPLVHGILRILKVILIGLLVLGLLIKAVGLGTSRIAQFLRSHVVGASALALVTLISLPSPVLADIPSSDMLKELEDRLLTPPQCSPQCVSMEKGHIAIANRQATIELRIDALAASMVPLPVTRNGWVPTRVELNGKPAILASQGGQLNVAMGHGKHRLTLAGPVTVDALELVFELPAHNLTVDAERWQVTGLVEGQVPGGSLQFALLQADSMMKGDSALIPNPIAAFVTVERVIKLGFEWGVSTHVRRVAPTLGTAINLEIPLLEGESVTSDGIKTVGNHVQVVMPAHIEYFSWDSSLLQTGPIELTMADNPAWTETWLLDVSPMWHVDVSGINPVKSDTAVPTWLPRPGERISIDIERPTAVEGAVQTVESAHLLHTPGRTQARSELQLVIRSSQGSEYPVVLPPGADVRKVVIDGVEQINLNDSPIRLPIHPGKQTVTIAWKDSGGIGFNHRTPTIGLATPPGNINLALDLPRDRWPLLVGGPIMGPALLYWAVLMAIVPIALLLGMTRLTPLRSWQWFLLGIGMSTVNVPGSIVVVLWFFVMARRGEVSLPMARLPFNLMQVGVILLTIAAIYSLLSTIPESLLSSPQMRVTGNGSSDYMLRWYQDRAGAEFPHGWVISLPIWIYRLAMLLWSLWIAFSLLSWVRWSWECFATGRIWMGRQVIALDEPVANADSTDG